MSIFTQLSQGENFRPLKLSLRLVAAGWFLAAIVLVNVYNGTLVSFLTVPKYEPIVGTLDELARSKTLKLAVGKQTIVSQYFLVPKTIEFLIEIKMFIKFIFTKSRTRRLEFIKLSVIRYVIIHKTCHRTIRNRFSYF